MAIIPPQRKSISQVKAQLLNPATTSHFQVSVSFQDSRFTRYKQELGLNLDQVDVIAASLLDFESSIASELEAELLLGKNINKVSTQSILFLRKYPRRINLDL